jgi:hypothetical protein
MAETETVSETSQLCSLSTINRGDDDTDICETLKNYLLWMTKIKKQSLYTPWRRLGGEEV